MDYKNAFKVSMIARARSLPYDFSQDLTSVLQLFSYNVRSHIPPIMYQFVRRHLAMCFWNCSAPKTECYSQMLVLAEVYASQTIFNSMPLSTLVSSKKTPPL